jgi:hypothetical protein
MDYKYLTLGKVWRDMRKGVGAPADESCGAAQSLRIPVAVYVHGESRVARNSRTASAFSREPVRSELRVVVASLLGARSTFVKFTARQQTGVAPGGESMPWLDYPKPKLTTEYSCVSPPTT